MGKGFSEEGRLNAIASFHERRARQDFEGRMKVEQAKEGHGPSSGDVFLGALSSVLFMVIIYEFIRALLL